MTRYANLTEETRYTGVAVGRHPTGVSCTACTGVAAREIRLGQSVFRLCRPCIRKLTRLLQESVR